MMRKATFWSVAIIFTDMNKQPALFLIVALLLGSCRPLASIPGADIPFDLWIRGGQVVDGSGRGAFAADVLLRADTIAYVGEVPAGLVVARDTIDAGGKYVTPGFLDPHAHGDPFATPDFQNFLAMGVTTISLGQDGFSPQKENMGVWLDSLDQQGTGTNVLFFAGHSTLRQLSGVGFHADPSVAQIESLQALLARQIEAGCWGLSTGLEYTPGMYASAAELDALAAITGRYGRVLMSHVRNEDDDALRSSLEELLVLGRHCRVHVSHLKSVYGKGAARAEEILAWLDSARQEGISVTADLYPYSASYTGIGIVFPAWAKAPNDYAAVLKSRRAELAAYLRDRVNRRNGPEATLIGTGPFTGKTLADIARETGKPFEAVLMDDMGPTGASGAYFVMNDELQERLAQDTLIMFCSDGSPTGFHPRGHGTFARVIETYVREKHLFSLEEAVRKMTSLPAQTIGMKDRGLITAGYRADVLVFDPANVRERASFPDPLQLASGMDYVIVNGKIALQSGVFAAERPGRVLRWKP